MARNGVLSDQAIKQRYPEFFPLDIGGQEFLNGVTLDKHIFKGIKPSRTNKHKNISRFPINDLANFASISAPARKQKAQFDAIMNYRKSIGSTNFSENLETAFERRMEAGYTPILPKPVDNKINEISATLSLGRFNRNEGQKIYSKAVPGSISYISTRMRTTLSNLVPQEELLNLNEMIFPGGFNPRSGSFTDSFILNKLNTLYRDKTDELNIIEKSYHAAGKQNLTPFETSNRFQQLSGLEDNEDNEDNEE